MTPHPLRQILSGIAAALIVGAGAALSSTGDTVTFDPAFRDIMHHYASVDRTDGKTYRLYINEAGIVPWRDNRTLPQGTVLAIESFLATPGPDGRLEPLSSEDDIHIAMKSDA